MGPPEGCLLLMIQLQPLLFLTSSDTQFAWAQEKKTFYLHTCSSAIFFCDSLIRLHAVMCVLGFIFVGVPVIVCTRMCVFVRICAVVYMTISQVFKFVFKTISIHET